MQFDAGRSRYASSASPFFSAVVGRHTAGVALRSDGVQGSAVRARGKGGNKQTVVAKPLFTLCTRGTTW
jgi:hypothetical protein